MCYSIFGPFDGSIESDEHNYFLSILGDLLPSLPKVMNVPLLQPLWVFFVGYFVCLFV